MSARLRCLVAALTLGPGSAPLAAQTAAPLPRPAAETRKEERSEAAKQIFERALADHLEAEKGGPDADAAMRRAAAGYRKVLALRPAAAAHYNLARAEEALRELANAESSYRSAASAKSADRAFYLDAWAAFLDRRGRGAEAAKVYEELLLLDSRHERAFAFVRERRLAGGPSGSEGLLDFLWRLVAAKQHERALDLALEALERGAAPYREEEALTVVAAALVDHLHQPSEVAGSMVDRRLAALEARPGIGRGVAELRRLYLAPGQYDLPFAWWSRPDLDWAEYRGVSRRDAFRALMRAVGDGYRSRGGMDVAAACYDAAVKLGDDPDPVALRRLATVFVETNRLDRLDALAAEYADPKSPFFAAKNQAYRDGQLEKVLLYHRTLGQIYGSLARAGKGSWGSTQNAASAMFQLDRAYSVASELDRKAGKPKDGTATRVDADLAVLYAEGLEATGAGDRATKVRLDAAQTFVAAGDGRSAGKMLRGVDERKLTAPEAARFKAYRKTAPNPRVLVPDAPESP